VQGYAGEALRSAGALLRALGRPEAEASALEARAERLLRAIDASFWMEDRGLWAMALDGEGRVDALASNEAHLLWSGAALPERARRAAEVMLGPEMFSGFGLRTMGRAEAAFSPIAHHNGSIWPHDWERRSFAPPSSGQIRLLRCSSRRLG
jgi:glycogen debranching enzyme